MSDPKRWLDEDGGVGPSERAFLQQGLSMDPPEGAQDAVWMALCAQIGAASSVAAAPAAAPQAAAAAAPGAAGAGGAVATGKGVAAGLWASGLAGVAKGLLIGLLCGGMAAGGYAAVAPSRAVSPDAPAAQPPPAISPQAPAPHSSPAPAAPASADPPGDRALDERPAASARPRITSAALGASAHAGEAPPPSPPAESALTERESRLRDERRMLSEARNVLRGGQAAQAIQKLTAMRERFPDGVLAQEREALAIDALARTGQREAAAARAGAFLKAYPRSPHRQRIESFTH